MYHKFRIQISFSPISKSELERRRTNMYMCHTVSFSFLAPRRWDYEYLRPKKRVIYKAYLLILFIQLFLWPWLLLAGRYSSVIAVTIGVHLCSGQFRLFVADVFIFHCEAFITCLTFPEEIFFFRCVWLENSESWGKRKENTEEKRILNICM